VPSAADAAAETEKLFRLASAAIDADAALLLVTIRSDAYGLMQSAGTLTGIDQVPLGLLGTFRARSGIFGMPMRTAAPRAHGPRAGRKHRSLRRSPMSPEQCLETR
jgi:hypothetical protein